MKSQLCAEINGSQQEARLEQEHKESLVDLANHL